MVSFDKWPPEIGVDPYYCDKWRVIYHADCRELPLFGVSAVVTDPPYETGFMNKSWDKKGIALDPDTWRIICEACLPGAMLLSFGGTRTSHRLACAIEDAGWQIRDTIMWVYGSGFPKSLDISKAIDKHGGKEVGWFGKWLRSWRAENNITQKEIAILFPSKTGGLTGCVANWELGFNMPTPEQFNLICKTFNLPFADIEEAERKVVGKNPNVPLNHNTGTARYGWNKEGENYNDDSITVPATPEAKLWEGYGTALKPAYENIIVAQSPLTAVPFYDIMMVIVKQIGGQICQLPSFARIAEAHSASSPHELNGELDIAQWLVGNNTNTLDILFVLTDTVRLESETNTNWNIVLLWLNILTDLYKIASKFTTSTETALITELKILKSLAWRDIFQNIIHLQDNQTNGLTADALTAVNLFNAIVAKLNYILTHSAQDTAILKDAFSNLRPNYEPIIVAMKPIDGTFAGNALKHKVAGLNIDGCRISIQTGDEPSAGKRTSTFGTQETISGGDGSGGWNMNPRGRFPANFIHDGSQEVMELFPDTKSVKRNINTCHKKNMGTQVFSDSYEYTYGDTGSAARFFYTAKASKKERDAGLELEAKEYGYRANGFSANISDSKLPRGNNHPTVKPLALMTYLCKLVKMPEYNLILDPFCGSGTTLLACTKLGIPCIGIDSDERSCEIAAKRCATDVITRIQKGGY